MCERPDKPFNKFQFLKVERAARAKINKSVPRPPIENQ
jgi:hypothetical protein